MKTLTINSLRLKNFKGIRDFTLEPDGCDITVAGDNATGKTTLVDAFTWVLFGKDSQGRGDFQLKPVDPAGQEIHNLETEVEAALDLDGKPIRLRKTLQEKWTKRRGQATAEFSGHTTDHFVDDVPVAKKDFDARVSELIDLNAFRLVSNPYEFAGLHWQARRNLLLEMCGSVDDAEVIQSDPELSRLADILKDCGMDDHRAKIKALQSKINKELKEIPGRISENQNMLMDGKKPDQRDKARIEAEIEGHKEKLRALRSNEAVSLKQVRINEIKADIQAVKNEAYQQQAEAKKPLQDQFLILETSIATKTGEVKTLEYTIAQDQKKISALAQAIEAARKKWTEEGDKSANVRDVCPACGQNLPEDQIEAAVKKFNLSKAAKLAAIAKDGKESKTMHDVLVKGVKEANSRIESLQKEIGSLKTELEDIRHRLGGTEALPVEVGDLEREQSALEMEVKALKNGSIIQEETTVSKIMEWEGKLQDYMKAEAAWEASQKAQNRIDELMAQEKTLAAEFERLESELYLTDRFIVRKVEMMEGAINEKFKMARFKLFAEQINGGLAECCEILFDGVPFDRGLNSAARINVGLDIINTLSEHFKFRAPVWIDNKESVNDLIPAKAQVISLAVSKDKALTVTQAATEIKKAS